MKIYLSASETKTFIDYTINNTNFKPYYHLFSYFYTRNNSNLKNYLTIKDRIKGIFIDSGAHTFHTAQNVDFVEYTEQYADFIRETDKPNVDGYFEMDIDNRIGYKNVLKLRRIIEEATDKVIPVWHKNRGFKKFQKMCRNYDYVSISCLPIEGIPDKDLHRFVQEAHDNDCKIQGLGGTRKYILENVPFDSVDSASWMFMAVNGRYNGKRVKRDSISYDERLLLNLFEWRKKQIFYENYWKNRRKIFSR